MAVIYITDWQGSLWLYGAVSIRTLPLAITMMAGPQILSALVFITTRRAVTLSLAYVGGIAVAVCAGLAIGMVLFDSLLQGLSIGGDKSNPFIKTIQLALVLVLIALAVRAYVTRRTSKPPKWLMGISSMGPAHAFVLGLLVVWLMPSDLLVMLTVAADITRGEHTFVAAMPFILATILIASLPLIGYLLFRKTIIAHLDDIHNWIEQNSWIINIGVYLLFIVIMVF